MAVQVRDDPGAMDALLSLKVTSYMVGATFMDEPCRALERALREQNALETVRAGTGLANITSAFGDMPGNALRNQPAFHPGESYISDERARDSRFECDTR